MRLCILISFAIGFSAVEGQDNPVKDEMKNLLGKWAQVSVEADGKKLTDNKDSAKVTLTITGEKWIETTSAGTGVGDVSTFKINPAKKPKQIDITIKLGKGKTLTFPGIYTLIGDTLTTAVPFPFGGDFTNIGKRPGEFRTKEGDGFVVTIYKRVKS